MAILCPAASANTKEDIYNDHEELDPFTDPEKFAEKFALYSEDSFDPDDYDYFYYDRDVTLSVGSDNVIEVTEFIDVYFKTPQQGITRAIPLYNPVAMQNDTHNMNHIKVSGIYSDSPLTAEYKDEYLYIKLGGSSPISGFKQYRLHYTLDLGKDPLRNGDEFLFSIIDISSDKPTLRCQFEINMPKPFDADSVRFTSSEIITYQITNNTIKGETNYHLNSGQALNCIIGLPEGYFSDASNNYDFRSFVSLAGATLMVMICSVIILRSRRANRFTIRLEYYPPREINSVEAAYLKYGKINEKKIFSLLPYLASRGYIGIKEISKGIGRQSRESTGYFFKPLKGRGGLRNDEKIFMEGMFGKVKSSSDDEEQFINDETIRFGFFKTIERLKDYYLSNKSSSFSTLYQPGGTHIKTIYMIIIMVLSCVGIAFPLSFNGSDADMTFSFFTFVLLSIIFCGLIFAMRIMHILVRAAVCAVSAAVGVSTLTLGQTTVFASEIAVFTSLVVMLSMCMFYDSVKTIRTPYGKTLYGRLLGFERFIKSADYGKLTKLLEENPSYYYDILPYTHALELSLPKNKTLEASYLSRPPEWFELTGDTASFSFYNITYMLDALYIDMTYRPTEQNADFSAVLGDFGIKK